MTVGEYRNYKEANGSQYKFKDIKKFWDTNPTEEQERLRSKITIKAMFMGMISGIMLGIGIMAFLEALGII